MSFDLNSAGAIATANAVRNRRISALEACDAAIARIVRGPSVPDRTCGGLKPRSGWRHWNATMPRSALPSPGSRSAGMGKGSRGCLGVTVHVAQHIGQQGGADHRQEQHRLGDRRDAAGDDQHRCGRHRQAHAGGKGGEEDHGQDVVHHQDDQGFHGPLA